ncbi:MAG: hypothetical protein ACRDV2_08345, partial [Actinomycetes bacterium]
VFHGPVPEIPLGDGAAVDGNRLRVPTADPAATLVDLVAQVPSGTLSSVEIIRPDLEAVYLALTGRRYDEANREGAPVDDAERRGRTDVTAQ